MQESRVAGAAAKHQAGYNCAQAVVCTYCDLFGVAEETAYKLAEAFGLGMGTQDTCGALTGALMVAGLMNSGGADAPGKTKGATYRIARELTAAFNEHIGAVMCRDIKTPPVKSSCAECVEYAARLVEERLLEKSSK